MPISAGGSNPTAAQVAVIIDKKVGDCTYDEVKKIMLRLDSVPGAYSATPASQPLIKNIVTGRH